MKTNKILFLILLTCSISLSLSAQQSGKIKIGTVKNKQLSITNSVAICNYLKDILGKSGGSLGDYQVVASPTADRFAITYTVSRNTNSVSSIGVMVVAINQDVFLIPDEAEASIGGKGSISYSCSGAPCTSCYPAITWPQGNWAPTIVCNCPEGGTGKQCNMSISGSVRMELK